MWLGIFFGFLLTFGLIPLLHHSLSLYCSFILSFHVCDSKIISVCEVKIDGCTCVKKKLYNGVWLKVI